MGRSCAAVHQGQQLCPSSAVRTEGVVHDPGDKPDARRTHVTPDVLVSPKAPE